MAPDQSPAMFLFTAATSDVSDRSLPSADAAAVFPNSETSRYTADALQTFEAKALLVSSSAPRPHTASSPGAPAPACILPSRCKHKPKNQIKQKDEGSSVSSGRRSGSVQGRGRVRGLSASTQFPLITEKSSALFIYTSSAPHPPFFSCSFFGPNAAPHRCPLLFISALLSFVARVFFFLSFFSFLAFFFFLLSRERSGGKFVHILSTNQRLRESALISPSPGGRKCLAGRKSYRSRNLIDVLEKCREAENSPEEMG